MSPAPRGAGEASAASPATPSERARLPFRSRAAIYLGLGTIQRAMALILAPLYAHGLSQHDFGLLTFILSLEALFGVLMDLGLSSSAVRAYFQLDRRTGTAFLAYAQFASLIASGAALLVLAGGLAVYLAIDPQPVVVALALGLSLISAFGQRINGLAAALYRAQEDAYSFAALSIARIIAIPVITIALALVAPLSLIAILGIRILVFGATAGWELRQAWLRRDRDVSREQLREVLRSAIWRYGLPLLPHNAMRWGRAQGQRVLLGAAMSMPLLALYGVAALPLQMLSLTGTASDQLFEPFYYRERQRGTEAAIERLRAAGGLVLAGQAALGIAAMAVIPDVLALLFPPIYRDAALYAPLLLAGQFFTTIQGIWTKPLVHAGRAVALPVITGVSTVIGVIATYVAASQFGMSGAVPGYYVTTAGGAALAIHFVDRGGRDPTVPRGTALGLSIVVSAAGILPLLLLWTGHGQWWLDGWWARGAGYALFIAAAIGPVLGRHHALVADLIRGSRPSGAQLGPA